MEEPTITILCIAPGKAPEAVRIPNTLEALQSEVGGTIEAVYPFPEEAAVVCHDEAKLIGFPLNRALSDEDGSIYNIIAGTFLVVGLSKDDFASLPSELLAKFAKRFARPEAFVRIPREVQDLIYRINMLWDAEAGVWVATSDDIPGLVLESGSFDALLERVRFAAPELFELNSETGKELYLTFVADRQERIAL